MTGLTFFLPSLIKWRYLNLPTLTWYSRTRNLSFLHLDPLLLHILCWSWWYLICFASCLSIRRSCCSLTKSSSNILLKEVTHTGSVVFFMSNICSAEMELYLALNLIHLLAVPLSRVANSMVRMRVKLRKKHLVEILRALCVPYRGRIVKRALSNRSWIWDRGTGGTTLPWYHKRPPYIGELSEITFSSGRPQGRPGGNHRACFARRPTSTPSSCCYQIDSSL